MTEYYRLNVYDYIDAFCGWEPLSEMIKYAGSERNQAYVTTLFKTGGRASEALLLEASNFSVKTPILIVSNMPLLKRFKKIGQDAESGKWITQKVNAVRKPFPIPLDEPLTAEMLEYVKDREGLLFPSPYTNRPLTRIWAYKLIRRISDALPPSLFKRLGLNRPMLDDNGEVIRDEIHLWLHWARSQRASQLSAEYDFKEADLMEWFGWLDYKTALHYSHLGYAKLAEKMLTQRQTQGERSGPRQAKG